ncbi:MAG: hypothetical protein KAH20_01530 [Methylococcales bacterium]|nr:hypothetical protein [Methylococcales bacterium]
MSNVQLPQHDNTTPERQNNLLKNQKKYRYKYDYESLSGVAMADGIPWGEYPHLLWIKKVGITVFRIFRNVGIYQFLVRSAFLFSKRGMNRHFKKMSDYIRYFQTLGIPKIAFSYQDDFVFSRMRVAGQNPMMISAVKAIDKTFPVDDSIFQSVEGFAHDSLAQAIKEQRLYFVDYQALEQIENGKYDSISQYSYAPKALFCIPVNQTCFKTSLRPIAIQCEQIASDETPIYTPNDGVAWNMAKTIIQIADFNYHELISHLAATHLLIEPFVIATQRQLADNHPLKILLKPHFEGTLFINWAAQLALVNKGGKVDALFSGTIESSRQLIANRLGLSFNEELFPNKMERQGLNNSNLAYPYRDDAQQIWQAIFQWVSGYLNLYYKNDQDVVDDYELKAWVEELGDLGKVNDFGNDEGRITTLEYLKQAVTMLIFTSSVQHAAVNFTQHDFSGYPPNMPAAGYTPAPKTKNQSVQDWLDILPSVNMSAKQVELVFLLSDVYYTTLGHYPKEYFKDIAVKPLYKEFLETLDGIEKEINERNKEAESAGLMPYDYLLPSRIPQSINI